MPYYAPPFIMPPLLEAFRRLFRYAFVSLPPLMLITLLLLMLMLMLRHDDMLMVD